MVIQKSELTQKINKLKGVVPKKSTIAALQGLLVHEGYLIANNMEMTVKAKIEGAEGETFIIPAKAFDLIGSLPDGEVEITSEGNQITIQTKNIKNKYLTHDTDDFPLVNTQEDGEGEFTIESSLLTEAMKRVSYAIPAQANNNTMTAMYMQAENGVLNFTGLDGHVIAWDKADFEGEFSLLIPKAAVEKIMSIGISGQVAIRHTKNSAVFITDEFEIYTRLIEGNYFNYQRMFNELPLHTVIDREEFLGAMTRAKTCTDENSPVRFEMVGNTISISIQDSTADYYETIGIQEEVAEKFVIGFDAKLIIETLKAFDCENVGISFSESRMPMIVEAEDSDFKAMVLPVAIRG
jgi:DNA polymerase III beta subunit